MKPISFIHPIISRARKLVEALLDSTSLLNLDAKPNPDATEDFDRPSSQFSIDSEVTFNAQDCRMLIRRKNA